MRTLSINTNTPSLLQLNIKNKFPLAISANYSMLITLVSIYNFVQNQSHNNIMDKEPILVKFGKKVQELRIEQNLSQEQLAELAGVHRTYIGMVERAEKNITLRNLEKIAIALKTDIKSFF